jgi:hypothetical protein
MAGKIRVGVKLKLLTCYNLVVWKTEMEIPRIYFKRCGECKIWGSKAEVLKIHVFWDVMLSTDRQTEIDTPKIGSAFNLTLMQQNKREIGLCEYEDGIASVFRNIKGNCTMFQNI